MSGEPGVPGEIGEPGEAGEIERTEKIGECGEIPLQIIHQFDSKGAEGKGERYSQWISHCLKTTRARCLMA